MPGFERLAAYIADVRRRTERFEPFGDRESARDSFGPTDVFGVEDYATLHSLDNYHAVWDATVPAAASVADTPVLEFSSGESFVIDFWIKSTFTGTRGLISKGHNTARPYYEIYLTPVVSGEFAGSTGLVLRSGTTGGVITTTTILPINQVHSGWHHILAGFFVTLLVDDRMIVSVDDFWNVFSLNSAFSTTIAADAYGTNAEPFLIGSSGNLGTTVADTMIDDVRVWSLDETNKVVIRAQRGHKLSGYEKGLVANWPFSEGLGTTIEDIGPSGVDASGSISWAFDHIPGRDFVEITAVGRGATRVGECVVTGA